MHVNVLDAPSGVVVAENPVWSNGARKLNFLTRNFRSCARSTSGDTADGRAWPHTMRHRLVMTSENERHVRTYGTTPVDHAIGAVGSDSGVRFASHMLYASHMQIGK